MSEEQHRAVVFFLGLFVFGIVVAVLVTCSGCGGAAFTTASGETDGAVAIDAGISSTDAVVPPQDVLLGSPHLDAAEELPIAVNSTDAALVEASEGKDADEKDAEEHKDAAPTCDTARCPSCLGAPKCCLPDTTCGCNLGGGCT